MSGMTDNIVIRVNKRYDKQFDPQRMKDRLKEKLVQEARLPKGIGFKFDMVSISGPTPCGQHWIYHAVICYVPRDDRSKVSLDVDREAVIALIRRVCVREKWEPEGPKCQAANLHPTSPPMIEGQQEILDALSRGFPWLSGESVAALTKLSPQELREIQVVLSNAAEKAMAEFFEEKASAEFFEEQQEEEPAASPSEDATVKCPVINDWVTGRVHRLGDPISPARQGSFDPDRNADSDGGLGIKRPRWAPRLSIRPSLRMRSKRILPTKRSNSCHTMSSSRRENAKKR